MLFFKRKNKDPQKEKKKSASNSSQRSRIYNKDMNDLLPFFLRYERDAVYITTSETCPCCSPYNGKVYNVLNIMQKYPPLPDFLCQNECPECGKVIEAQLLLR